MANRYVKLKLIIFLSIFILIFFINYYSFVIADNRGSLLQKKFDNQKYHSPNKYEQITDTNLYRCFNAIDTKKSIDSCKKLLRIYDKNKPIISSLYLNLGMAYLFDSQINKGIRCLNMALSFSNQAEPLTFFALGMAYNAIGDYENALANFETHLKHVPDSFKTVSWIHIVKFYLRRNDQKRIREDYYKAKNNSSNGQYKSGFLGANILSNFSSHAFVFNEMIKSDLNIRTKLITAFYVGMNEIIKNDDHVKAKKLFSYANSSKIYIEKTGEYLDIECGYPTEESCLWERWISTLMLEHYNKNDN